MTFTEITMWEQLVNSIVHEIEKSVVIAKLANKLHHFIGQFNVRVLKVRSLNLVFQSDMYCA